MIQAYLLRAFAWRVARLLAWCFFGALILLSGCTLTGAGLIALTSARTAASGQVVAAPGFDANPGVQPVISQPVIAAGFVTDTERFSLAVAAGFSPTDAIIATAISIAEDGSGDPAIISPRNRNGTYDLGLWEINSVHWNDYGGEAALMVPLNNARAAHAIYASAGWCSWSTYLTSCGVGYTGAYAGFLGRARAAAQGG